MSNPRTKSKKTKKRSVVKKVRTRNFIIPKLFVSTDTLEAIRTEALNYGQFETGGLLMGEKMVIKILMVESFSFSFSIIGFPCSNSPKLAQ